MDMGKGPEKVTTTYKLTAGGSAIVETVFDGAPHEMVTVYHDNTNGKLTMTHYCMLGNQPKMILKSMEKNVMTFDLSKDADIDVANATHMHGLRITFDGKDKMKQDWKEFKNGKQSKEAEIACKRIK